MRLVFLQALRSLLSENHQSHDKAKNAVVQADAATASGLIKAEDEAMMHVEKEQPLHVAGAGAESGRGEGSMTEDFSTTFSST